MTPANTQIELLREVMDGKTVFVPKSHSDEDMNAFQVLAEELIELGENNHLTGCRAHRESHTGKRQIDHVMVVGLTAKGRRSAEAMPNPTSPDVTDVRGVLCPNCKHTLEETVDDQKSTARAEAEVIPGLTRTDTLVLKISCEFALKTEYLDFIETQKILEALRQIGIPEQEVWESLELLNERGYIAANRVLGGGKPFQIYSLELSGFHAYANIFIPDYSALINRVIHAIGVNELQENFEISEALGRPVLLIVFILDLLENNGLLTQSKRLGGKTVISRVTVELIRRAREIDENQ